MFGWIDSGGGVDTYFNNTRLIDVLLRTSRSDNKVVIGNANGGGVVPTAGLYVASNCVGVRRVPDAAAGWALDVGGNVRVTDAALPDVATAITPHFMSMGSNNNVYLSHLGGVQSDTVFAASLKRKVASLVGVQVLDFDASTHVLQLDYDYNAAFQPGQVLCIAGRYLSVLNVDVLSLAYERIKLELGLYFAGDMPDAFDALVPGGFVNIEVMSDLPDPGAAKPISVPLNITSFAYRAADPATVDIVATLNQPRDIDVLKGRQLCLVLHSQMTTLLDPTPNTLVFLDATTTRSDGSVALVLRTPDGRASIADAIGTQLSDGSIYIVPTQTQVPSYVSETRVVRGYVASADGNTYTVIRQSLLQGFINGPTNNVPDAQLLDKFAYVDAAGAMDEQLPDALFSDPQAGLFLHNPDATPSRAYAAATGIRYRFAATPVQITSATIADASTITYTLDSGFFPVMATYENAYVHVLDGWSKTTWRVISVIGDQVKLTLVDPSAVDVQQHATEATTPRWAYMLPFKYLELTELGNGVDDCSIYSSLSVGTRRKMAQGDRLTVAGPVALQNQLVFYDSNDTANAFAQRFVNGSMDLNDTMFLSSSLVRVTTDMNVQGDMTATSYNIASDARIKRHIAATDPARDLRDLMRLDVREFVYKDHDNAVKKGLVAQEVEAVVPAAINTHTEYAPTVCAWARLQQGGAWLHLDRGDVAEAQLELGDRLRVMLRPPGGAKQHTSTWDVIVDRLHLDGDAGTMCVGIHPSLAEAAAEHGRVFVYGQHTTYRTVDYSHLVAMCINSIQALAAGAGAACHSYSMDVQ